MKNPDPGRKAFGLDALRAAAALLVLLSHAGAWWEGMIPFSVPVTHLFGHAGVEAFFVLSGFLIGGVLIRLGPLDRGRMLRFWARRLLRTVPLFLVAFILFWLLVPRSAEDAPLWMYLTHTAFMPMMGAFRDMWFPVAWSLAVEEWAYLLVPLVLAGAAAAGVGARGCLVLLLGVLLSVRWSLVGLGLPQADAMMGTPFRMEGIVWGMLAAHLAASVSRERARAAGVLSVSVVACFSLALILGFATFRLDPWFRTAGWTALAVGIACGMWALSAIRNPGGLVARLVAFGAATSYPVYLIHLLPVRLLGPSAEGAAVAGWKTAATLAVAYGGGWLLHKAFEEPFLRFGERFRERSVRA